MDWIGNGLAVAFGCAVGFIIGLPVGYLLWAYDPDTDPRVSEWDDSYRGGANAR